MQFLGQMYEIGAWKISSRTNSLPATPIFPFVFSAACLTYSRLPRTLPPTSRQDRNSDRRHWMFDLLHCSLVAYSFIILQIFVSSSWWATKNADDVLRARSRHLDQYRFDWNYKYLQLTYCVVPAFFHSNRGGQYLALRAESGRSTRRKGFWPARSHYRHAWCGS